MFEHILVPIDGSNFSWAALAQAAELAKEERNTLHVLYVVDERLVEAPFVIATAPETLLMEVHPDLIQMGLTLQKKLREQGKELLAQARARCEEQEVPCRTELAEGNVTRTILDRAGQADLIAMGRLGSGEKWGGPLLGSSFEAVVRHSPVPVLGVQREVRPLRRILVAYDGSDRSQDALEIAIALARHHGREIVLLTVDDGHGGRKEAYERAEAELKNAALFFTAVYRAGHVSQSILEVADETQCDLIVMGAYGHTRFLGVLFGSTVDDVMRRTTLPILICR